MKFTPIQLFLAIINIFISIVSCAIYDYKKTYFNAIVVKSFDIVGSILFSDFTKFLINAYSIFPSWVWVFVILQFTMTYFIYIIEQQVKIGNPRAFKLGEKLRLAVTNPDSEDYYIQLDERQAESIITAFRGLTPRGRDLALDLVRVVEKQEKAQEKIQV